MSPSAGWLAFGTMYQRACAAEGASDVGAEELLLFSFWKKVPEGHFITKRGPATLYITRDTSNLIHGLLHVTLVEVGCIRRV